MSLSAKLSQWSQIDAKIKKLNEEMRKLRQTREELEQAILGDANKMPLDSANPVYRALDGTAYRIVSSRQYEPLTMKYLMTKLSTLITNESQVNKIMQYLRDQRKVTISQEIKAVVAK